MESNSLTIRDKMYYQERLTEFMPRFCDHARHIPAEENIYSNQSCVACSLKQGNHYTSLGKLPTLDAFCELMETVEELSGTSKEGIKISFKLNQRAMYSCPNRHNSSLKNISRE